MSATTPTRSQPLRLAITVIIERDGDRYHAFCPALKGLHVDGGTEEEALERAREAVHVYLKSVVKHGDAIPLGPDLVDGSKQRSRVPAGAAVHTIETRWPVPK